MGIDYDANYGIGYKVVETDELLESDDIEEGLHEYLCDNIGDEFETFKNGCDLSGRLDGVYITVKNPFKDGLDLTSAKQRLDDELKRLKVSPVDEFNEVGGLLIW